VQDLNSQTFHNSHRIAHGSSFGGRGATDTFRGLNAQRKSAETLQTQHFASVDAVATYQGLEENTHQARVAKDKLLSIPKTNYQRCVHFSGNNFVNRQVLSALHLWIDKVELQCMNGLTVQ